MTSEKHESALPEERSRTPEEAWSDSLARRAGDGRFGALAEALPALVIVLDPELRPIYVNRRWREFYGTTAEVAYAVKWKGLVHPDDLDRVVAAWSASIPRGRPFEAECRLLRRDGETRWHLARTVPVRDEKGNIKQWCSTLTDIDDIKRAEQARREFDERYHALFEAIDEGFAVIELLFDEEMRCRDFAFLETNSSFERHTGFHAALGKTVRQLVPELDDSWFSIYGDVALTGRPHRFDKSVPSLGRWFSVYALRVGAAHERRLAVVFSDVTEQRRREFALRESEERFRTLADNIAQLAWMMDAEGVPFWYNQRWYDYTGAVRGEEDVVRGVHPAHAERVREKLRQCVASGRPWEDTFPLRGMDGQYRWFLARAGPIRNDAGEVVRWFGTHTDITDHRRAQEALTEADRRKNEFLAVLAHELRNPLAPVRSAADLLSMRGPRDPELQRASQIIGRQVKHMSRLIDDLLDVSRVARGQIQLRVERCDLAQIVRMTAEDYRSTYDEAGVALHLQVPATVCVQGDPVRLSQMVGNLLSNAAKFTSKGGRVDVEVGANPTSGQAHVSVTDTGVGIGPSMLERLFVPFSQADTTLDRRQGGLGLGLALVKSLATMHGGTVTAESPGLGEGATFTLRFPLSEQPESESRDLASSPASATEPGRKLRIAVIEDNVDAAELLQLLLEMMGHEVHVSHDGTSGVELSKRTRPDVVLSDIGLPGPLDGYGVARTLRADPTLGATFLVALSGYGQQEDRRRAVEAGFDAHLVKPAQYEDLRGLLATVPTPE